MKRIFSLIVIATIIGLTHRANAQSVTLYTAGPAGLAKNIAESFTDKTGIKVEVYQATSGDVLARLEAEKAKPRADVVVLASWGEGLIMRQRGFVDHFAATREWEHRQWQDAVTDWELKRYFEII